MDANSRQFQAIFDQSPAGMVMLSPVAEVLYANNVVTTMLGVSPEEARGGAV